MKSFQSYLRIIRSSEDFEVCVDSDEECNSGINSDEERKERKNDYSPAQVVSPLRFDFKSSSQASVRKKKKTKGPTEQRRILRMV